MTNRYERRSAQSGFRSSADMLYCQSGSIARIGSSDRTIAAQPPSDNIIDIHSDLNGVGTGWPDTRQRARAVALQILELERRRFVIDGELAFLRAYQSTQVS